MSFTGSFKTYFNIFYNNFLGILVYPYELLITVIQPAIEVGFMALFWNVVTKNSPNHLDLLNIVTYFIMVQFVQIWAMNPENLNFVNYLSWRIKFGQISQTLIRPIRTLPTLFLEHRGFYGIDMIFSFILLAVAIKLIGTITLVQIAWFAVFLILALIISFSFSVMVGSIAFVTNEVSGIRNSAGHVIRVLSGVLIPISLFPQNIKSILVYSPFPSMVFTPINVLQNKLSPAEIMFNFEVAAFWAVVLFSLALIVWHNGIKRYESIGI